MDDNRIESSIFQAATLLARSGEKRSSGLSNCQKLKSLTNQMTDLFRSALFPDVFGGPSTETSFTRTNAEHSLARAVTLFRELLGAVLPREADVDSLICSYVESLPTIAAVLETDVSAAYLGDPAAISESEIMLAYPSFEALSIYRLAHRMYELQIPLIPRMMTEYAHRNTGIDIHPGASIGEYFFIDHGTGVVIGETCTIGHHVKLYQGVTLGAKSFELDENGNPVKGIKRHPDIGNNVVIYAGATVLGGNTVVGDDCVIGGNVWLTHSVPAGESVYNGLG